MKADLIQRGNIRKEFMEEKAGVDKILSFQYMGSSEFEHGAKPQSLARIRANKKGYCYHTIKISGKNITAYLPESKIDSLEKYLTDMASGNFSYQEYTDFDNFVKNPKNCSTDFWWDIKNDLMFWEENPEFESKFKEQI